MHVDGGLISVQRLSRHATKEDLFYFGWGGGVENTSLEKLLYYFATTTYLYTFV